MKIINHLNIALKGNNYEQWAMNTILAAMIITGTSPYFDMIHSFDMNTMEASTFSMCLYL